MDDIKTVSVNLNIKITNYDDQNAYIMKRGYKLSFLPRIGDTVDYGVKFPNIKLFVKEVEIQLEYNYAYITLEAIQFSTNQEMHDFKESLEKHYWTHT